MMKKTRSQFVIKGNHTERTQESPSRYVDLGGVSEYHKRVIEARQEITVTKTPFEDISSRRAIVSLENHIFSLQDRSIATAEAIEFQAEKERFLDQEIALLTEEINQARKKKIGVWSRPQANLTRGSAGFRSLNNVKGLGDEEGETVLEHRKEKLVSVLNETKAKNLQLRHSINDLRKERAVLDELFTKLERGINKNENKLSHLILAEQNAKKYNNKKKNQISNLDNQLEKEKLKLVQTQRIGTEERDLQVEELDNPTTLYHLKTNQSVATFTNSFAETFDQARYNELLQLKGMLHKITVLAQEDDIDFIYKVYREGSKINENLYNQIHLKTQEVSEATIRNMELTDKLAVLEKGLDADTLESIRRIKKLEFELVAHQKRFERIDKHTKLQKLENENLNVASD